MSFRQDFVKDLPSDPADAIVVLADRAQDWLGSSESPDDAVNVVYIQEIFRKFFARYQLDVPVQNTGSTDEPTIRDYISAVAKFSASREVDKLLDDYDATSGHQSIGVAVLTQDEKTRIHQHLGSIREIVEASALSGRKKDALFTRLTRLAEETDREGTRTDRFFAFAGDAAFVLGDMAEKAKPFLNEVKDILKIVSRSRARHEGVSLPHGDEPLKLPSPNFDS